MSDIFFLNSIVKMPLLELPVCSPIIDLSGQKILISPGSKLTENQLNEINGVTDIVAPNSVHGAGVPQASKVFSQAHLWAHRRTMRAYPNIKWTHELTESNWPYQDELPIVELLGAPKINETIFYHKKSKSLIVTDFCFNLVESKGLGAWFILNLFGTYKQFAISRFWLKFVVDKEALV